MQKIIKDILSMRISKGIVDILLIAGLVVSIVSGRSADASWGSFHCLASMAWYALILVHICQHWKMTKSLRKWNVAKRNKVTVFTNLAFLLMTLSIILFVAEVNPRMVHIHHIIAHLFWAVIVVHTITKAKQLMACFCGSRSGIDKEHS